MTLSEISDRLVELATSVESFNADYLSEELFYLSDKIGDLHSDVVGTISGISQILKEYESRKE